MTTPEHIERIRAATTGIDSAINEGAKEDAYFELIDACNLDAMRAVLGHIDTQQAEIERLKAENAKLLSDVTRPESIDVGLMRAEIERLNASAVR